MFILFISKFRTNLFHAHPCFTAHTNYMCLSDEGICFRVAMQISMRIQIIVGIWVLVSMMVFMPGKGEHETGIFCHFYGNKIIIYIYIYIYIQRDIVNQLSR